MVWKDTGGDTGTGCFLISAVAEGEEENQRIGPEALPQETGRKVGVISGQIRRSKDFHLWALESEAWDSHLLDECSPW